MKKTWMIALLMLALVGCQQAQPEESTSTSEESIASTQESVASSEAKESASEAKTSEVASLKDGTYETKVQGHNGEMTVSTTVKDGKLAEIKADHKETPGLGDVQIDKVAKHVVDTQALKMDAMNGATVSTNALLEAVQLAVVEAGGDANAMGYVKVEKAETKPEKEDLITWDATPSEGIVKGDYYKIEERFRQGHLGTLEVIVKDDKIDYVYFNEYTRPNYYNRYYQNVSKRFSEYNVTMKERKGAAWIEGVLLAEKQVLENQSLSKAVDTVSGASNSIQQSFIPLAEKLSASIVKSADFKGPKFYQSVKAHEDGTLGVLKLVVENGKIADLHYDEIFPMDASKIADDVNKKYAGLSKYDSVEYDEPSRIGFNVQMDALKDKVLETQDLKNLEGLPAIESTGDYKSAGYTERNSAWDHYLQQADILLAEMKADGVFGN